MNIKKFLHKDWGERVYNMGAAWPKSIPKYHNGDYEANLKRFQKAIEYFNTNDCCAFALRLWLWDIKAGEDILLDNKINSHKKLILPQSLFSDNSICECEKIIK